MRISKSDYIFSMESDVIMIEDLNLGRMSVTNDAENVITELYNQYGDQIKKYPIIYKDSEGIWDGLEPVWGVNSCTDVNFYPIGETNRAEAVKKAKSKL